MSVRRGVGGGGGCLRRSVCRYHEKGVGGGGVPT